jgi:ABC-2 type transport system permease protein
MSAVPTAITHPTTRGVAPIGPMLWRQTRAEFLKLWRSPGFSISSLALPAIFFAFFGLPNAHYQEGAVSAGRYILASFAAYGVISVMLFSFGVGVAVERSQRMNVLLRATPLRPIVYLGAKVLTALVFALLMLLILFAFAAIAGGIRMDAGMWLVLTGRLLLGALPFIALGFAVGYLASPNAAAPIIQILFLILSFASGLFIPMQQLPSFIQEIAPYLPTYRYGQLAWNAIGYDIKEPLSAPTLWLLGYGIVFVVIAVRAYRREDQKSFG